MSDTRNFAPPERMVRLCNKAIDVIAMLVESNYADHTSELYSWLSKEVGMTDEEIKQAGFDCVPDEDAEKTRTGPINCVVCGCRMVWEHPSIPGIFMASSCYEGGDTCRGCLEETDNERTEPDV